MSNSVEKLPKKVNFTNDEKVLLMQCVAKYKSVIECKTTNGSTWHEKSLTWDKVTLEFNSQSPARIYRSKESLKKCYENKKADIRKLVAKNKQALRATGGGTYTPKTDPCLDLLTEITNKKTIEGIEDEFGGDALQVSLTERVEYEDFHPDNENVIMLEDTLLEDRRLNNHSSYDHTYIATASENMLLPSDGVLSQNIRHMKEINDDVNSPQIHSVEEESHTGQKKTSWRNYKAADLNKGPNEKLRFASDRRRPKAVQPVHTNFLSKQYSEVATLKQDYLKQELEIAAKREAREEEESRLRKRALQLDIQIKELQLKKLKDSFE